ncbi:hypothetical protein BH11PAT1_BH11PAT1_5730 [soil metagenome]
MYYSHSCTYCTKIFFTYHSNKEQASIIIYRGIKEHLIVYDEDHKEHEMDDGEAIDSDQIYYALVESNEAPAGGYEL